MEFGFRIYFEDETIYVPQASLSCTADGLASVYKTEVRAFIEKYRDYEESFGGEDDSEKPEIVIILNKSKKGNTYVNFDLVGD